MAEETAVFQIIRLILLFLSPLIFIHGLFLVFTPVQKYEKFEEKMGKEIGGIRKRILPNLETNIYTFHKWLMGKKKIIGMIWVIYSILIFIFLNK